MFAFDEIQSESDGNEGQIQNLYVDVEVASAHCADNHIVCVCVCLVGGDDSIYKYLSYNWTAAATITAHKHQLFVSSESPLVEQEFVNRIFWK